MGALEALADRDPRAGAEAVRARLADPRRVPDPLRDAEAASIAVEAHVALGETAGVRAAASDADAELAKLPPAVSRGAAAQRVRDRLTIDRALLAVTRAEHEAALVELDALLARVGPASNERSCTLVTRSQKWSDLGRQDRAAADALEAYRIAKDGGFQHALADATFVLAIAYRRSGLYDAAVQMARESAGYSAALDEPANLAGAEYVLGTVLFAAGRLDDAKAALERSRGAADRGHDAFGVALADNALCGVLVELKDLAAAEPVCRPDTATFARANRHDLTATSLAFGARIALERGDLRLALERIAAAFAAPVRERSPTVEAQLRKIRADVYAASGRYRESYEDQRRVAELERASDAAERARAVTMLTATVDSARLAADNRLLRAQAEHQADDIANRETKQRLTIAVATGAALAALLLGWVLTATRRHEREVRRQQAILHTVVSHAPDVLVLLDPAGNVRFANRSLFGTGPAPEPGAPLYSGVPGAMRRAVEDAMARVLRERAPVSFATALAEASGEVRHFELRGAPVIERADLIGAVLRIHDVTDLRRLEREVIDVVGRERQRLGSDLHEGLGQELTGISLLLKGLVQSAERGHPVGAADLKEIGAHVARAIDVTRELARGLSPVSIERGSLTDALARLARDASQRLKLDVRVHFDAPAVALPEAVADHLYRIAYEALTNAARHSGCARVDIELEQRDGRLELAIVDDGHGVPATSAVSPGLGLKLMAYRARLVGGSLRIERGPQRGTRVVVDAPAAA